MLYFSLCISRLILNLIKLPGNSFPRIFDAVKLLFFFLFLYKTEKMLGVVGVNFFLYAENQLLILKKICRGATQVLHFYILKISR